MLNANNFNDTNNPNTNILSFNEPQANLFNPNGDLGQPPSNDLNSLNSLYMESNNDPSFMHDFTVNKNLCTQSGYDLQSGQQQLQQNSIVADTNSVYKNSVQNYDIRLSGSVADSSTSELTKEKDKKNQKKISPKTNNTRKRKNETNETENGIGKPEKEKKKAKSSNQRRNIKKVFTEDKLNEATLRALNEEKERQERLNSVQSVFSNSINPPVSEATLMPMIMPNVVTFSDFTNDLGKVQLESTEKMESNKDFNRVNISPIVEKNQESSANSSSQSICIIEDDEFTRNVKKEKKIDEVVLDNDEGDIIELNDDDDCQIIEGDNLKDSAKKPMIRGIHMNDELNKPDANGQVLINVNHPLEDPDVNLLPYLARNIKMHQIGGVRFMYDNIVESISRIRIKNSGFGCILAHAMGLGKTFQVISFIEVFLRCTCAHRVLCIVPINTIQNWQSEFNNWLPEDGQQRLDEDTVINYKRPFKVYLISDFAKTLKQRTEIILDWKNKGGVLLIGYEMFRTLVQNNKTAKQLKNQKKLSFEGNKAPVIDLEEENPNLANMNEIQVALLTPCLVVCDEGHRIKNNMANIAKTLQKIVTKRRIVLTGYPLQNNLTEYWCMVDFVRPSYLGTKAEFANMFERPIMNGQCMDSTREDVKLMRYRAHVLHSLLEGFVQRRGHDVFYGQLTQKQEYIILLKMSAIQKELYLAFMEAIGAMNANEKSNPLKSFAICCKIWNHPDVLYKYHTEKITDDLDLPDFPLKIKSKQIQQKSFQSSNSYSNEESGGFNPFGISTYQEQRNKAGTFDPDWASKLMEKYSPDILENGAKFVLSIDLIEQSVLAGDKILLFSQSLLSLDLIERYLATFNVANLNEKWTKNKHYYRLDGSTNGTERERLINAFNKSTSEAWLFLLSTRAGCLGINLVGANRVIVLDASWNPCHDAQAVCRVYRYGQKKTSYIYRLVADHTMEKKIYDRQVSKQSMSDRVVDEIQAENHFTRTEVEKLIHFVKEDVPSADLRDMPEKFDDQVLISSCMKNSHVITKEPFTHESLLLDKKEYQLSEREKNMAFRDYHHEKKYFPTSRPSTYSQFYQRMTQQNSMPLQSSYSQLYPSTPQLNPNINYSSYPPYNNSSSNSSTSSSSSMSSTNSINFSAKQSSLNTGIFNEILNDNSKDLDFNLHNITSSHMAQSYKNNNEYNSPTIMKCLNSKSDTQFNNNGLNSPHQKTNIPEQSPLKSQTSPNLRDVKITKLTVTSQMIIPGSSSVSDYSNSHTSASSEPIIIQPGQQVYVLTSSKGMFLRTPDKRYIAINNDIKQKLIMNIIEPTEKIDTTVPSYGSQTRDKIRKTSYQQSDNLLNSNNSNNFSLKMSISNSVPMNYQQNGHEHRDLNIQLNSSNQLQYMNSINYLNNDLSTQNQNQVSSSFMTSQYDSNVNYNNSISNMNDATQGVPITPAKNYNMTTNSSFNGNNGIINSDFNLNGDSNYREFPNMASN